MPFESTVAAFAAALCEPAAPPPAATRGRQGAPDARRFAVYRNNVAVGLIGALEARYPVVRRMLGLDAFRAIARAFIEAHKPRSPVLIAYGETFPAFIEAHGRDLALRRLADVARLENAWVEAYHAEDAPAAALADLAALDAEAVPNARVALHPAARLLSLATPAASIWASCQDGGEPVPPPERGEDVLVARPDADVSVRILPPAGYVFAKHLQEGARLAEASGALPAPDEFGTHLVGLVAAGAVAQIIPGGRT
ncbi:MAG TPA: DNA-binding domain-containing protein [Roseiarcus sp.]|nr:DNA-binding domain-containing protein [Roseiarcus sp.]